jgi:hypothetical protein
MTKRRTAGAVVAAFVVSQVLAVVVHGFLLNADYEPFRGSLLRAQASWQMLLLPVSHLVFIAALVWVFGRVDYRGGVLAQGAKLGLLGWMAGQAPLWLLWYAEQPWPGSLVVKQLGLELISSLIIGVTIAAVAGKAAVKTTINAEVVAHS